MTVPDPLAAYRRATFNRKDGNGTGRKERGDWKMGKDERIAQNVKTEVEKCAHTNKSTK